MSRYRLWFAIDVRHAYFSSGWCDGVRVRPTPACERLMRSFRLLFKPTEQGGEVYFDEEAQQTGTPGSLLAIAARDVFAFTLTSGFAPLVSYTAIDAQPPAVPGASFYAFDNLGGGTETFGGVAYPLLHPAGQPFAFGAMVQASGRVRFQADAPVSQVTVRDAASGAVVQGPQAIVPASRQVALALANLPEGRYVLAAPGMADRPFFLTDAATSEIFAMVAIHPLGAGGDDASQNGAPCLDANGRVTARRYTVALDARRMRWRYLIVPHATQASDDWRIDASWRRAAQTEAAAPLEFIRADAPAPVGARHAVMFMSSDALRVAERPGDAMSLKLAGSALPEPVSLPFPDVTQGVSAYRAPGEDAASADAQTGDVADVFVYL